MQASLAETKLFAVVKIEADYKNTVAFSEVWQMPFGRLRLSLFPIVVQNRLYV